MSSVSHPRTTIDRNNDGILLLRLLILLARNILNAILPAAAARLCFRRLCCRRREQRRRPPPVRRYSCRPVLDSGWKEGTSFHTVLESWPHSVRRHSFPIFSKVHCQGNMLCTTFAGPRFYQLLSRFFCCRFEERQVVVTKDGNRMTRKLTFWNWVRSLVLACRSLWHRSGRYSVACSPSSSATSFLLAPCGFSLLGMPVRPPPV